MLPLAVRMGVLWFWLKRSARLPESPWYAHTRHRGFRSLPRASSPHAQHRQIRPLVRGWACTLVGEHCQTWVEYFDVFTWCQRPMGYLTEGHWPQTRQKLYPPFGNVDERPSSAGHVPDCQRTRSNLRWQQTRRYVTILGRKHPNNLKMFLLVRLLECHVRL